MLDPAHVVLVHSVSFSIDPPERQLEDGRVRDFVAKPGVLACSVSLLFHAMWLAVGITCMLLFVSLIG